MEHISAFPRRYRFVLILLAIGLASLLLLSAPPGASAQEEVSDWQKGVTVRPLSGADYGSPEFRSTLDEIAALGANYVTLILPFAQETLSSTQIGPGWNAPSDAELAGAVQYAHSLDLAVNLKPHLSVQDDTWRANIDPSDREAWFASYGRMLNHYADLAEREDVEMITVGAELINMAGSHVDESNTENWEELIDAVRNRYSGDLTYSANWGGDRWSNEKDFIEFWDELDYIGIAGFVGFDSPYRQDSIEEQWAEWSEEELEPLHEWWDKPVIFTEIGYRSGNEGLASPWDWNDEMTVDYEQQETGYEAFFSYWSDVDWVQGAHWWEWKIGPVELPSTSYSPQNKPAEDVLREWFGGEDDGERAASDASAAGRSAGSADETAATWLEAIQQTWPADWMPLDVNALRDLL